MAFEAATGLALSEWSQVDTLSRRVFSEYPDSCAGLRDEEARAEAEGEGEEVGGGDLRMKW